VVKDAVRTAVRAMKVGTQEVFLPLSHPPGKAQVDFGFAEVVGGVSTRMAVFVMNLPYADAGVEFFRANPHVWHCRSVSPEFLSRLPTPPA